MDTIDTSEPVGKKGLSRRQVIVGGAVGTAAFWSVPIIDSVTQRAAAAGSTITTACSYFELVYMVEGVTYADRVNSDGSCGGNTGSSDVNWCFTCGADKYDNQGSESAIRQNNTQLASSGCTHASGFFNVSGNTITPGSGVTILFAIAHAGSLNSTTGTEPGTASGDTCNSSPLVAKVNVVCGPISSASFNCLPTSPA